MQSAITQFPAYARRSPLAAFLLFSTGISWLVWLAAAPSASQDPAAFRHLVAAGVFAPSALALLISLVLPETRKDFRWDIFVAGTLVSGLLYFLCLPYASTLPSGNSSLGWAYRLALWALPAFLAAAAFSGSHELRALLLPARFAIRDAAWYAAALLVVPILMGGGYAIALALGETAQVQLGSSPLEVTLTLLAVFIYILLFGGALGEESGLRGFLLPRLQARWSPLVASLLLGAGWTVWRLPLSFNGYYPAGPDGLLAGLLLRALFNLLLTFPLTWLYNRTRANLLACLLLHAAASSASVFLPLTPPTLILLAILSFLLIVEGKMWQHSE